MWKVCLVLLVAAGAAGNSAMAAVIHVPADQPTIQAAINVASSGDEIVVSPGTYSEMLNTLGKAIYLHSQAGAATTVLNGNGQLGPLVTIATGEGSGTILEGFTCTGGAVYNSIDGRSPVLGGAMRILGASPTIRRCLFVRNTALGQRPAEGGAVYSSSGNPAYYACVFAGNHSSQYGGALAFYGGSVAVYDCSFIGNLSSYGGAIAQLSTSSLTITNCTFTGNVATYGGGAYFYAGTGGTPTTTIVNSILWGDGASEIYGSTPSVTYCDVQGGYAGGGNIIGDPRFVRSPTLGPDGHWGTADDDYGDLRLSSGSPAIDAASNPARPLNLNTDLASLPRYHDDVGTPNTGVAGSDTAVVDMGAVEFQGTSRLRADFNSDGVIDQNDLALFRACKSGPSIRLSAGCEGKDFDGDGDVDQDDFGAFQRCFSGSGHLPDPNCLN